MHPSASSPTRPAAAPPGGRTRARRRRALTAVIAAIAPIAAMLTVISVPTMASATTVPGPPSGWSTVFSDDFEGSAGSGIDSQWIYDTGAGSSFGTGEIETMTNSTSNVYLDGNGDLDITALEDGSGNWTSGRVQTSSAVDGSDLLSVSQVEAVAKVILGG